MHFAFLLDSSVSMNAPFQPQGGMTYWECAKAAVEHFLKVCPVLAVWRLADQGVPVHVPVLESKAA